MKTSFGVNLSTLRKRAGMSQEQLAERLVVSRQAVSNWERDLSEPDLGTIQKISELLDVQVSELMGGPADRTAEESVEIKPWLTVVCVALAGIHLVLGICGAVNIFAVMCLPGMCAFIHATIYIAFKMMIKSNNYDMLAGFDPKKDSIAATRLQMYWLELLSGLTSIVFEIIFVLVYFTPAQKQMDCCTVMLFSYFAAVVARVAAVNLKIKTREKHS